MARKKDGKTASLAARVQRAFGKRLHDCRRDKKANQHAIGGALAVSRTSVSNIERGKQRVFLDQLYAAANELGLPLESLLPPLHEVFPKNTITLATDPDQEPLSRSGHQQLEDIAFRVHERLASESFPRSASMKKK